MDTPEGVNLDIVSDEGQWAAIGTGKPCVSRRVVPVRVSGADGGSEVETYAFVADGSISLSVPIVWQKPLACRGNL